MHSGIAQRKNLLLVEGSGGTEGTENELLVGVYNRGLICALSLVVDIASLVELLGRSGGKGCDAACNDPKLWSQRSNFQSIYQAKRVPRRS